MLKNGPCPQCGSSTVVADEQGIGWDVYLYLDRKGMHKPTGEWMTYLCADCGFFENYVTDQKFLDAVRADPDSVGWRRL